MNSDNPAGEVSLEGVCKRYGTTEALIDVDLVIPRGSFTVLLGSSGSGKSTLLRCLAGIERLSAGRVSIGGRLVAGPGTHVPPERRDLSMVFQDYALWPHMTVAQNVAFALKRRAPTASESAERLGDVLERVGMGHLAERYPTELSGGEQQRVALARALVGKPGLLLFDEPLSNLDADLRERLRLEIADLTRDLGATAVYITHDQAEAFALADQVGVLSLGRLVQVGRPEEVYERPATPFVARFTGLAGELSGTLASIEGDTVMVSVLGERIAANACGLERAGVGDAVQVLLRPASLGLVARPDVAGVLGGHVVDVAFRGRGYDHAVELRGGIRLAGIFAGVRRERGTSVGVSIDAGTALIFPASSGSDGSVEEMVPDASPRARVVVSQPV